MANQVAARMGGDDYQHLFAWAQVLELLMPSRKVRAVIVEDEQAGSADDVTILHLDDSLLPDRYHQIKYHVDHRDTYTESVLTEAENGKRSLLQKWFDSWQSLIVARPGRAVEIHILSNWNAGEDLGPLLSGRDSALKQDFYTAGLKEKVGKLRARLAKHLGVSEDRFIEFARTLRIRLSYCCERDMAQIAADRMEWLGLKSDDAALYTVVGIVREWVKAGKSEITKDILNAEIDRCDLRLPPVARPSVNVYLQTIKEQVYEIPPDYTLDWRHYFLGRPNNRGHEPLNPADWNGKMLPELEEMESRINTETSNRFVRVRGQARLAAWFAFGAIFSEVNRYTLEVDQGENLWQTSASATAGFSVQVNDPDGEPLDNAGDTVAVGISVTGLLECDVREHLKHRKDQIRAVLFLRPTRELGPNALQCAGDAVALANEVKNKVRLFVNRHQAKRVLIYYFGPLSGACFIGHRFNAVCPEWVVMERVDLSYSPSFVL